MNSKKWSLKRKFAFQFISQYVLFVILSTVLMGCMFVYSIQKATDMEYSNDFSRVTTDYIKLHININKNTVELDKEIEEAINKQSGWLQIVDTQNGSVKQSLNTPSDVHKEYTFNTLDAVIHNYNVSNYDYQTWEIKPNHIVIFGVYSKSKELINMMIQQEENVSSEMLDRLKASNAWYVTYGTNGDVQQKFNVEPNQTSIIKSLVKTSNHNKDAKYNIATHRMKNGNLLVVGTPNESYGASTDLDYKIGKTVISDFLLLILTILILLVLISYYYARKWGKPILKIIQWIQNLGSRNYDKPTIVTKVSKKKAKKSEKLFAEITTSLEQLTDDLTAAKCYREELEQMREEWITGVSHDLKTPLSSIMGYSILLKNNSYTWSAEELKGIGETLTHKAEYINALVEDLNLTYNLKHMPLNKVVLEVDSLIRKLVIDYINHPKHIDLDISYSNNSGETICYPIDKKQFQRIINNLLANAAKYAKNNEPIQIEVTLTSFDKEFCISIKDNGIGMDERTQQNLFTRYYRGTSTVGNQEGTGLGLAITKQLVQAHEGTIKITSEPNIGTEIDLYFPKGIGGSL